MKTIPLAAAVILAAAGMASAADANLPVDSSYNWSGAYLSAQAGYAWGDARVGQTFAPGSFDDYGWGYGPSGGFGGLYAGYNKQFDGGLVLGVDDPAFGGELKLDSVGSLRLRAADSGARNPPSREEISSFTAATAAPAKSAWRSSRQRRGSWRLVPWPRA